MAATRNVAVIVGSLRKESFNRKMARALVAIAPPPLKLEIVEIGQLPLYNADYESDPPQVVRDFKQKIESFDAVLFVTPEYNRGVPGVLKNAIDVGSRPYGKSSWSRKPAGVIVCIPDLNPFVRACRSRLSMTTPWHFLRHRLTGDRAVIIVTQEGCRNDSRRFDDILRLHARICHCDHFASFEISRIGIRRPAV